VKFSGKLTALAILLLLSFAPAVQAETLEEQLNNLVGPTEQYNTMLSPVYLRTNTTEEQISPQNGELTITQTDFVLPGRNGLDVELKRIYKNSSANVQEMKVRYVNGAWVDYVYSDAKTSSFYEDRYNLGIGTRFSFASMEIRANSDGTTHKFLHTESGDVYRLKAQSNQGEAVYLPEGQTVQDVVVKETAEYTNGQADGRSKYVMAGNEGKKSYFTEDGRLVGIVDRYGNTVKFEYAPFNYTVDGQTRTRKLLTSITDTIGRVITFEYKEDGNFTVKPLEGSNVPDQSYLVSQNPTTTDSGDLEGKFQVIVHVPGGQTIVYDKSAVLVSASKHVVRTRLQRVYDLDGQVKYHLWYEQPDLGFTFMNGSKYAVYNRYENLTQIDYVKTNRIKRYVYNTYTNGLNDDGSMQVRKVFGSKELVKQGYDPSQSSFLDRFSTVEKDKTDYAYTNEADGYGTEGYKKNDSDYLKNSFRYLSTATDSRGNTVTTTFDGIHQQLSTERNGSDHKETITTERDEMKLVKKQETVQHQVAEGRAAGVFVRRIENYRYDQYGNLTNYTGPEAERDGQGYPVNNEHTVVYSYAYDKYHILQQKTWKTDSQSTAQILYEVDAVGNVVKETKLTGSSGEPPVVTAFQYDSYGNMIRKEASSGPGSQSFITEYRYGVDGSGADTRGAYVTEELTIAGAQTATLHRYAYDMNRGSLTADWDGKGNRTSYEYDLLGRVLRQTAADGAVQAYEYREGPYKNLEIQLTDAKGNAFLHQYDILGSLVRKDIRDNGAWAFQYAGEYDGKGNKVKETDANGNIITYAYDSKYRLTAKTFYEKGTVNKGAVLLSYTFTGDSLLPLIMSVTDEEGNRKTYHYDALDRLVKLETTADGSHTDATLYAYNYVGNKISDTDANGHQTTYSYDLLGRQTGRKDSLGNETKLAYNAVHQVVRQEEPGGKRTELQYDPAGRLTLNKVYEESDPAKYTYTEFGYDGAGNRDRIRVGLVDRGADQPAADTEYGYDVRNRLTDEYRKIEEGSRSHIRVSYDAVGNKSRVVQYADAAETKYRVYDYQYDYAGRLLEETGAYREHTQSGSFTDYGYYRKSYVRDGAGNVLEERNLNADGGNDVILYAYDYRNQVVGKTMPYAGGQTKSVSYQYDKTGRKISESMTVRGAETTIAYAYDGLGRLVKQTDALGNMIRYLYDAVGNRVKQIDARYGHLPADQAPGMEYEYDALNRLIRSIAFDGATRTTVGYREYDSRGNVVKEVAGEGFREDDPLKSIGKVYVYDVNGRKLSETSAQTAADNRAEGTAKVTSSFAYDGAGNVVAATDARNQTTRYFYYSNGLLKRRLDPDGLSETYEYDRTGKAYVAVTDRAGRTTRSYLNIFDKPYRTEYPDGTVQTFHYSPKGELLQVVDQNGGITYLGYDASGNVTEKKAWIRTEGDRRYFKVLRSEYDEANRVIASETFLQTAPVSGSGGTLVSAGDRVENEYDKAGRLIRTIGPNGRELRMEYDRAGQVITKKTKVAEGVDEVRRYEYDLLARVVKDILLVPSSDLRMNAVTQARYDNEYYDRLQSTTVYAYDKSGSMTAVTDPNRFTVTLNYDLDGRAVKKTDPLQASISYVYDGNGNVIEEKNAKGISTFYDYDALNRQIRKKQSADGGLLVTRYVLDALGNVLKEIAPNQYREELDRTDSLQAMTGMAYTYDVMNRRTSTLAPDGTGLEYLLYDGKGQVVKQVDGLRWNGDFSASAGTGYEYDGLGRLTAQTDALGHAVRMAYNVLDQVVRHTDARGYTTDYAYDPDGTLRRVEYADGGSTEYTYDKLGRLLTEKNPLGFITAYGYNAFGQVRTVTDAQGQVTENKTDLAGNVASSSDKRGSVTLFSYDGVRRLTEKRIPLERDDSGNLVYAVETYRYDAAGNLTRKSMTGSKDKSFLRETVYTYTDTNLLHTETGSSGSFARYAYDKNGNLTKRETLREADRYDVETYDYDTQDRLVRQSRLVERGSLDDGARLAAIPALQDAAYPGMIRLITGYAYDLLGNRVKELHPLAYAYEETDTANRDNYTVSYAYDALNRLVGETRKHQGADVQVRYGYDANGNRISAENERGAVTSYAYDARNRVLSMTDGEGQTFRYVYDAAGNKLQDTNAKGYSMSYRYDGLNRLVEVIDPYGAAVTRYAYDENGNMVKKMDALGILSGATDEARDGWVYEYDLANRLVKETDPELAAFHDPAWFSAAYRYNPAGELVEQTDALGHVTRYAYNQAGLLVSVTDPLQVTTAYSYDRAGNKRTMTDGRGKTVSYGYGSFGLLLEAVNAAGRRETYRYDLALQAAVVQDGNGYHTRYGYDNRGRMLSKRVTETGDEVAFTYDEAGNRLTMTDESGASQYAYDRNNRLVRVEKDGARQLAYTYDAIGNVESVTDRLDHITRYGYDKSSRMETVDADGKTTTYRYDANGNREAVTYPGGVSESYVYDKDYRLLSVMNRQQDGSVISQYAYTYDEKGQQISKTDSYGKTDYTYDAAGRITRVEAPGKTTAYAYDDAGNRQSLQETYTSDQPSGYTEPNSGVETAYRIRKSEYLYAKDNRLQKLIERMQDAAGKDVLEKTTEYLYDGNGNELRQKVVYLHPHTRSLWQSTGGSLYGEGVNQVSGEGTEGGAGASAGEAEASVEDGATPEADAGTPSGADAPNVGTAMTPNTVIEKVSNTFDGFNRLKKSERVKDGEQVSISFVYDGDGLRTRKTVRSSAEGYMEQTTNYLYDRQYVVLETDANGAMSTRYVRGINYISRTGAGEQTGTAQAGEEGLAANDGTALTIAAAQTSYFLYNGHGDVVQTISEDGTVENQYDYDIFGNPTLTIELYASAIRYAGEFYDAESGLYYLRARYYNPYTGRFISEDSYWGLDTSPLSLNRYTYAHSNPVMHVDPSGHFILKLLGQLLVNSIAQYVKENKEKIVNEVRNDMVKEIDEQKQIWADEESNADSYQEEPTVKQNQAHQRAEELKNALAALDKDNVQVQQMLGRINEQEEDWEAYKAYSRVRQVQLQYDPITINSDTKQMQQRLNELGYTGDSGQPLAESGVFDSHTLNAVNKFKEKNQLGNDGQYAGKVGETTWLALFSNSAFHAQGIGMTLVYESSGVYVSTMQNRLSELGYVGQNGKAISNTGTFDDHTLYAVNQFKETNNLWNTGQYAGKVGDTTWIQMFSENAILAPRKSYSTDENTLGVLSKKYESNGKPGTISGGGGDIGGASYGAYQFASAYDVPYNFVQWLQNNNKLMYEELYESYIKDGKKYGSNFNSSWKSIAENNSDEFLQLQHGYTKASYYDVTIASLQSKGFDITGHSVALKNVIWSRSVQHGPVSAAKVIMTAFNNLDYNNVSEEELITAIYKESGATVSFGKKSIVESNLNNVKNIQSINFAKEKGIYGTYMKYFSGNSADVQIGVWRRLNEQELSDALKMLEDD
jgi:RHS repeat-associated protein